MTKRLSIFTIGSVTRAAMTVLATGLLITCGPPPPVDQAAGPTEETRLRLTPQITTLHETEDGFRLAWTIDRSRRDIIRGYNVYVSETRGLARRAAGDAELQSALYNLSTFPGDTDGDIQIEEITVSHLLSGVRYFVHVRTVFPNGDMSPPSEEIAVVPRPRGRLTLHLRFSENNGGFSFRQNAVVPTLSDANDLYLFAGADGGYLASPSRLNRALRKTRFVDLGPSESLDDYPELNGDFNSDDNIRIQIGRSIALLLADGRRAKIRPVELSGSGKSLSVILDYVYQPIPNEPKF